jgi:prepilin-type N-terminal cleavage/methylation domain-containing protein
MTTASHPVSGGRMGPRSAFTLVEIAICIAVVSIAMVAIIGVLPAGLNVQRLNREESVLTQDAELLLNAVRAGQVRLQDLVNYADRVTLIRQYRDASPSQTNYYHGPLVAGNPEGSEAFVDPFQLIGLISRPRYTFEPSLNHPTASIVVTNTVRLEMRSMSGSMANQPVIRSGNTRTVGSDPRIDFAFRYLVTIETVTRQGVRVPGDTLRAADTTAGGVSEVRLTLEWPLVRSGPKPAQYKVGLSRREFRTEIVGGPSPLVGNVPQDRNYFGPILFPFRPLPRQLSASDVILYRFQPGSL